MSKDTKRKYFIHFSIFFSEIDLSDRIQIFKRIIMKCLFLQQKILTG